MRPQQRVGKLASSHRVRSKDSVGSRTAQLLARFFFRDARHNRQPWVQGLRRENDEEIFRIRGQSSDQSLRFEDTSLPKADVLCGIRDNGKHSCCRRLCNTLLIAINHQEGSVCPLTFITSVPAPAAKTEDDQMVVQLFT